MTSYIFLDTLRFFAHHGVGEQETVVGNEFTVSLRLQVDIRRAAETDDVADTVSYADVHTAVKAEMDIPSKLLEHVCGRIINRLFHDFPQIEEITLKLAKRNPPMGADIEAAEWNMPTPRRMTDCRITPFTIRYTDTSHCKDTCMLFAWRCKRFAVTLHIYLQ